jgi:hypothetical protein
LLFLAIIHLVHCHVLAVLDGLTLAASISHRAIFVVVARRVVPGIRVNTVEGAFNRIDRLILPAMTELIAGGFPAAGKRPDKIILKDKEASGQDHDQKEILNDRKTFMTAFEQNSSYCGHIDKLAVPAAQANARSNGTSGQGINFMLMWFTDVSRK